MLVIDAVMGSGKSTWAINHINKNRDRKWLYVTPFLTELERVSKATGITPVMGTGGFKTKTAYARSLLQEQQSLVITHSLFVLLNKDDLSCLRDYHIIIDETLPVTKIIPIASAEINLLIEKGFLTVVDEIKGAKKLLVSTPEAFRKTKTAHFFNSYFDEGGELFLTDNNIVAVLLPECFFNKHNRITILTYQFDNTELDCYLDLKRIPVEKKTIVNGELVDYIHQDGSAFRGLINVVNHIKLNEQVANKSQRFTKAWYGKRSKKELIEVKNNLYNFFRNVAKTKPEQNLWSVFVNNDLFEYMSDADGAMWMTSKRCTREDLKDVLSQYPFNQIGREAIDDDSSSEEVNKRKCFIPLNCKGTNLYSDRTSLAYLVNLHLNPAIKLFFKSTIDRVPTDDMFALNMMTQWLFRGCVRNGESMTVYIPSKRMRHLLLKWLGYTDDELF